MTVEHAEHPPFVNAYLLDPPAFVRVFLNTQTIKEPPYPVMLVSART